MTPKLADLPFTSEQNTEGVFPSCQNLCVSSFPQQLATKDVESEGRAVLYFLMSNSPRKVNTPDTSRLASEGEGGRDAYTVVYNVL